MSLKSFDDFCAKMVNNEPLKTRDIFDERQSIVRSKITFNALRGFVIVMGINLLIMEAGPQWCESWVLSTALIGACAYLYWVIANARRSSLFGINGTNSVAQQAVMWIAEGIIIPFTICTDHDNSDFLNNFFIRNEMISEYFISVLICAVLLTAGIVMLANVRKYKRNQDVNL